MAKKCPCNGNNPVFSKGLCVNCWRAKTKPIIKKQSDNLKTRTEVYNLLRIPWLKQRSLCEANLVGCTKKSTQVHHKQGRIGNLLTDTTKWFAVCQNCHQCITDKSKQAVDADHSIKRNHSH